MRVICTNIGPAELGGQVEWEGSAADYSQEVANRIRTAFDQDGQPLNRETVGHVFVTEMTDQDRRDLAARQILKYYPEWRQLNILRTGTEHEQIKMSQFIDACRSWSNNSSNVDPFGLDDLRP
jgi:hypothetical protein